MPIKKIVICVVLLIVLTFLSQSVKSEDVVNVKLRTCCELNTQAQGGSTKCSELTDADGLEIPANLMSSNNSKRFQLSSEKLICSGGKENPLKFPKNVQRVDSAITFYPSGYLLVSENPFAGQFYHIRQYCIKGITDSELELVTCRRHCTPQEPCIKKCCPPDLVYSRVNREDPERCKNPGPIKWTPKLFKTPNDKLSENELEKILPLYSLNQAPAWISKCPSGFLHIFPFDRGVSEVLGKQGEKFETLRHRIRSDGKILFWNIRVRKWEVFEDNDNYCVDGILYKNDQSYNDKEEETLIMTCPIEFKPNTGDDPSMYYGIFAIITSPFALTTFVVYGLLSENIRGWTIMSLSASVFVFFVLIGTAHLTKTIVDARTTFGCVFLATMAHYFFLSTFAWLALISFDLWVTFRFITISKEKGLKRFLCYSAIGWGIPLFIICLSWTLELMYKDDEFSEVVVPMYGVHMCYLTHSALGEYVYTPCAILQTMNLIFFVMTTWNLYKFKYFDMSTKQVDCQSYVLFVKLFVVVGVLWIFEIISWAVDKSETKWYWQILDSLNVLSPVALFFIFVFKYDVCNALGRKYPALKPICQHFLLILAKCEGKRHDAGCSIVLNTSPMTEEPNTTQQITDSSRASTLP